MGSTYFEIGILFLARVPFLLALVVGLIRAITRRHHAPRAMRLLAVGFGLMIFTSMISPMVFPYLAQYMGGNSLSTWYTVFNLLTTLISTSGMVCIVLGAFADRTVPEDRGFPVVFDSTQTASRPPQAPPPL